ncbi:unnamed protein product [Arctogadus glacialis]
MASERGHTLPLQLKIPGPLCESSGCTGGPSYAAKARLSDSYIVLEGIRMYRFPVALVFLCLNIPGMVIGEECVRS